MGTLFRVAGFFETDVEALATVDGTWVHRVAVAEVFVTDCVPGHEQGSAVVGVQLPRRHCLYRPLDQRHDSMALVEAWRQSVICLAHTIHAVPADYRFTLQSLTLDLIGGPLVACSRPTDLHLHVQTTSVGARDGVVTALEVAATIYAEDKAVAVASCSTRILPPAVYTALRHRAGTPLTSDLCPRPDRRTLIDPAVAGVHDGADVVLSSPEQALPAARGPRLWELVVDPGHPVFFDHPLDHVPGMLIVEGFRQGARVAAGNPHANLTALTTTFTAFAELNAPVAIMLAPHPTEPGAYTAQCLQHGSVLATATLHTTSAASSTEDKKVTDALARP